MIFKQANTFLAAFKKGPILEYPYDYEVQGLSNGFLPVFLSFLFYLGVGGFDWRAA